MNLINAGIGIILNHKKTKVYISLRQSHQTFSDHWEFPGGKVELGETFAQCVKRELYEEVGIVTKSIKPFLKKEHYHNNTKVRLEFFTIEDFEGCIKPKENQILKLVNIADLRNYKFLTASLEAIDKLKRVY